MLEVGDIFKTDTYLWSNRCSPLKQFFICIVMSPWNGNVIPRDENQCKTNEVELSSITV